MQERVDTSVTDFPEGEGPPLYLTAHRGNWEQLAPGQSALIDLDGEDGGVFAWGLVNSAVVIWIRLPDVDDGAAYCHHSVGSNIDPRIHAEALHGLGVPTHAPNLYVVIAARREVHQREEQFFTTGGLNPDRVFTYSNSVLPQFGVSAAGCIGEAR